MRNVDFAVSLACVLVCTLSCGGGSSTPTPPTVPTTPTPAPTPTPTNTWSIAGRVVDTAGRQPISGAQITPSWDLAPVVTEADGSYALGAIPNPPSNPYKLTVSAPGCISREVWIGWQAGARTDVTLDVIRDSPPFAQDFYRQLVRGAYDQLDGPWNVRRLNRAPSFYVRTVDQNGRPIEPEVLATIYEAIGRAVPAYSGQRLSAAAIESGVDARAAAPGWINVDVERPSDPTQSVCGYAQVGTDPGAIKLYDDVCSCGSRKIPGSLVMHEVGHALGFFHVGDRNSVMYPFIPGNCPPGDVSAAERFHSAIAYSRPRGNAEPDIDPSSGKLLKVESATRIVAVN